MSLNVLTTKDENGAASPWIEIYNPTGQDIDLTGYALTDDFNSPKKAVFPSGVVAKAHGTVLLWADQNPAAGPTHVNLFLPAAGGSLGLARPDGSFINRLSFGAQSVDLSAAREPDGSSNWVTEWNASPGAANPTGMGQPLTPQAASDPPEMIAAGRRHDRPRARLRPAAPVRPADLRRRHRLAARGADHLGPGDADVRGAHVRSRSA